MAQALSTNTFTVAKWVVSPDITQGTHTTIAAALTSASAGDTIFIRDGTYTEDITLKAGVTLTGIEASKAIIVGKATASFAGTCNIDRLTLQTNSDFFLTVSGANATLANFNVCILNCANNTGISFTSSNASSQISLNDCGGDIGTTGISLYNSSSAGRIASSYCGISNSGGSTTASTNSAGVVAHRYCQYDFPISSSGTGIIQIEDCLLLDAAVNSTSVTHDGSGANSWIKNSDLTSGTASGISIGASASLIVLNTSVASSNTNAITGSGSISYAGITYTSSTNINTTTQTVLNQGPSASFGSSNSGNTNTLTSTNTSNTASSGASIIASVAGTSAGDPVHQSIVSGTTAWTWGVDNSDADAFVIAASSALGTNNIMSVATTGEINYPLQPCFLAYQSSGQTNITGDNTTATITFTTEIFDQNSDFDGTSTFTAPVTGRYMFEFSVTVSGLTVSHTSTYQSIITSNRTYISNIFYWFLSASPGGGASQNCVIIADMDIGDTCICAFTAFGGASKVVSSQAGADLRTRFCGKLTA